MCAKMTFRHVVCGSKKRLILFAVWDTILNLRAYLEEHAEPIMFLLALESYFNQLKAI